MEDEAGLVYKVQKLGLGFAWPELQCALCSPTDFPNRLASPFQLRRLEF